MNEYELIVQNAYRIAKLIGWKRKANNFLMFEKEEKQMYNAEIIEMYGTFELMNIVFEINEKYDDVNNLISMNNERVYLSYNSEAKEYYYNTKEELILALQNAIIFCYENMEKKNAI